MSNELVERMDRMTESQHKHEKEFVKFEATSDERYRNLSSKLDEMNYLLKTQAEEDDAQSAIITDLNNRVTTLEVEKRTIEKMNKIWLAIGVLVATLLAGPASKVFDMIFN